MAYNLILDDIRTLKEIANYSELDCYLKKEWITVRNFDAFCDTIKDKGLPEIISFDHDIADFKDGKERTGKDAAQFVIDYCIDNDLDFPAYHVHSANPRGTANIKGLISDFIVKRNNGFFL